MSLNTQKVSSTQGMQNFGHIAPEFARITDEVLFDHIWERTTQLSKRERSLITVACLMTQSRPNQLLFHFQKALDNGIHRDELAELITHLAFYAGWPSAATAIDLLDSIINPSK